MRVESDRWQVAGRREEGKGFFVCFFMKTREEALALLREFTSSPSLIKHAFAVEAAMRAYAVRFREDPEYWGPRGTAARFRL